MCWRGTTGSPHLLELELLLGVLRLQSVAPARLFPEPKLAESLKGRVSLLISARHKRHKRHIRKAHQSLPHKVVDGQAKIGADGD